MGLNNPPGGRPSKFTPERCAKIIDSISHRIPYQLAAEANGICEDTLYEWLKIGMQDVREGKDTEYARFSEMIKETEQKKIKEHLAIIKEMPDRWQAQAWILERRWWKHFSSNAPVLEFEKRLKKMEEDQDNHGKTKELDKGSDKA